MIYVHLYSVAFRNQWKIYYKDKYKLKTCLITYIRYTHWGSDKILDRVNILQKHVSCVSIYFPLPCQDVLSYKLMGWNSFQFVKELRSSFSYECDLNWLHKEYLATKYTTEKVFCLHNVALNRRHKDYLGQNIPLNFCLYKTLKHDV